MTDIKAGCRVRIIKIEAIMMPDNHAEALQAIQERTVFRVANNPNPRSPWPLYLYKPDGTRFPGGWKPTELALVQKPTIII